jgi:ribonuclease HI
LSKLKANKYLGHLRELLIKFPHAQKSLNELEAIIAELTNVSDTVVDATSCYPLPKEISDKNTFAVFSDGACRGNPGPGAYGFLIQDFDGSLVMEEGLYYPHTTNNQMEMMGALRGLQKLAALDQYDSKEMIVHLYSDSKYVVDGMNSWVHGWKKRGWKKSDKKPPENLDLWQELDQGRELFSFLKFHWVKGHAGHPQNERCDELANIALDDEGAK